MSNQIRVDDIARELDIIACGGMYICPCCQNWFVWDSCETKDDDDGVYCPNCDDEAMEEMCISHYLDYNLGVEYRVDGKDVDYINSVRICVAYGGPNIYIDTGRKSVDLYWWGDDAHAELSNEAVEQINECFEELWNL